MKAIPYQKIYIIRETGKEGKPDGKIFNSFPHNKLSCIYGLLHPLGTPNAINTCIKERNTNMSMQKVSLARALKERKRLAGQLVYEMNLISQENSKLEGEPKHFDVQAEMHDAEEMMERLIGIRTAISEANFRLIPKLVELDEVKSIIPRVQAIDVKEDSIYKVEEKREIKREVVFSKKEIIHRVAHLQHRMNAIQDEIDDYNAKTQVVIDLED